MSIIWTFPLSPLSLAPFPICSFDRSFLGIIDYYPGGDKSPLKIQRQSFSDLIASSGSAGAVFVPALRSGGGAVPVSVSYSTDWKLHTYMYEEGLVGGPAILYIWESSLMLESVLLFLSVEKCPKPGTLIFHSRVIEERMLTSAGCTNLRLRRYWGRMEWVLNLACLSSRRPCWRRLEGFFRMMICVRR